MNRLTERNEQGAAYVALADTLPLKDQELEGSRKLLEATYAIFQKLAAYEDTGLEPEDVLTTDELRNIDIKLGELIDYKNLEEQGRLHIAPIPEGTEIYVPFSGLDETELEDDIFKTTYMYGLTEFENGEMNKDWFLTKEEAEKALEGVNDNSILYGHDSSN